MQFKTDFTFTFSNLQTDVGQTLILNNSFIKNFLFIESLEHLYIIAELEVTDRNGFFERINFTGREKITVNISQILFGNREEKDYRKTITFEIYNSEITNMTRNNNVFKLFLVEEGAFEFFGISFNKTYKNKRISEIITDVMRTQLKLKDNQFEVEPTLDILENFTLPYWKPAITINNLRKKARRKVSPNESGFLFFSCFEKEKPIKKFISIASLIEKKFDDKDELNYYPFKDYNSNEMFINTISECETYRYTNNEILTQGIGGKHYFGINYNNDKNIIEVKEKYSDYIKKSKMLNKTSFFNKNIDNINSDVDFIGGSDFIVNSKLNSKFRNTIENFTSRDIIVNGSLMRYVGQKIFLEHMSDNSGFHILDTGKWIIKAISYSFEEGDYIQRLTIFKDSHLQTDIKNLNIKTL